MNDEVVSRSETTMPDKLTDERLREIAAEDEPLMQSVAVHMRWRERIGMARELLFLRAHGEAAPVAWRVDYKNGATAFTTSQESAGWHDLEKGRAVTPLYSHAPPPEEPYSVHDDEGRQICLTCGAEITDDPAPPPAAPGVRDLAAELKRLEDFCFLDDGPMGLRGVDSRAGLVGLEIKKLRESLTPTTPKEATNGQ